MKFRILFGLIVSVALLAMFGCGGDGGGGTPTSPTATGPTATTVVASAGPGGTISPPGTSTVLTTFSVSYTITPNPGYTVSDVVIDGFSFGAITSFEFLGGGHTIHATFTNRPKTAIVKLLNLNPPTLDPIIYGIEATLLYTQNPNLGLSNAPGFITAVASGNGVVTGTIFTADTATTFGQIPITLSSTSGIRAGEFATVTFKLMSSVAGPIASNNVPSSADFNIASGFAVTGFDTLIIPGIFPFVGSVIIK
ncbi:MAG: hypothetical protein JJE30_07425 [Desulfuromonadales bacterium]|nr:hypothetical protein [Desulfuromonadales bacterium]